MPAVTESRLTFGSTFAGAGGGDIGFERAGLKCVWQVEIDAKANSVRRKHWPDVPHFEDVRYFERSRRIAIPDIIIGGWPCQDLSVAGKREGLKGERSGLFYHFARIVCEFQPGCVVWENVPGLLSSDGGRDFERAVNVLADAGYFGCSRVLDARWFGVPQRRRRVFGVFCRDFGGRCGIERAAEILAVREGLSGNPQAGEEAGEGVAGTLGGGSGKRGWGPDTDRMTFVPHLSPALKARDGKGPSSDGDGDGDGAPLVVHSLTGEAHDASEDGTGRGTPIVAFTQNQRHEMRELDMAGSLAAEPGMTQRTYLAFDVKPIMFDHTARQPEWSLNRPLKTDCPPAVADRKGVRRLTPRECERLMSWPDDWTRWGHDGKEIADGPRYRMIGNGMVSNVVQWIARRIIEAA